MPGTTGKRSPPGPALPRLSASDGTSIFHTVRGNGSGLDRFAADLEPL